MFPLIQFSPLVGDWILITGLIEVVEVGAGVGVGAVEVGAIGEVVVGLVGVGVGAGRVEVAVEVADVIVNLPLLVNLVDARKSTILRE